MMHAVKSNSNSHIHVAKMLTDIDALLTSKERNIYTLIFEIKTAVK